MTTKQVYDADRLKHPWRYSDLREGVSAPKIFVPATPAKRIRQSAKPLNKLEREFEQRLRDRHSGVVMTQAITFRLANGVRYTPDFIVFDQWNLGGELAYELTAYEVKGFMRDDANVKLKVAASAFPQICWNLAWKENREWKEQAVIP
jgi:hypothetical protein